MTEVQPSPAGRHGRSWRRPAYLMAGLSLLALGAVLNLAAEPDPGMEVQMEPPGATGASGNRYAMKSPLADYDAEIWGGPSGASVAEAFGNGEINLVGMGRGGGGTGEGAIGLGVLGLIGRGAGGGSGHGRLHAGELGSFGPESGYVAASSDRTDGPQATPSLPPAASDFTATADDPRSTFSIDVDTAAYARVRGALERDQLPDAAQVRVEEMINYFDYDYPQPQADVPFSVVSEVGPCPWNADHRLVHIGVQGKVAHDNAPKNLVFLVDTSGSMSSPSGLGLVKSSLRHLTQYLTSRDRVSIVAYAGQAGVVLRPTPGDQRAKILDAVDNFEAAGGTNGAAGIKMAYSLAKKTFIRRGVNRVVLATDGDFNLGVSSHEALVDMVAAQRKSGVFLSVLGFRSGGADHTMEQLADKGNGNYAYIDNESEARKVLVREANATLVTIAKDVKIQVEVDPSQVKRHRLVGYRNRLLAHRDFADDRKDAGELGAGHTVTALYEIEPAEHADGSDLMKVRLRYKKPRGRASALVATEVKGVVEDQELANTSENFRWSAAVAMFGQKLAGSEFVADVPWARVSQLAATALGDDPHRDRTEMLGLIELARGFEPIAELPPPDEAEAEPPQVEPVVPHIPEVLVLVAEAPEPTLSDEVRSTLRLLPPLLALPMFVMAFRRPRRRRDEDVV